MAMNIFPGSDIYVIYCLVFFSVPNMTAKIAFFFV